MNRTGTLATVLGGLGLGATVMYVLDPDRGRRRRAVLRDKLVHAAAKTRDAVDTTARDVTHRAQGAAAEMRSRVKREPVRDDVLVERVRARLGRVTSHPGAIEVSAIDGRVTLRGPILADEVNQVLAATYLVRGVKAVENSLEVHADAGDIPALQGGGKRPGLFGEPFQRVWSPTMRLVAGMAGSALALTGLRRGGGGGTAMGVLGLGVAARGVTNLPLKRLLGIGPGADSIRIRKTIKVAAPPERVYHFWTQYDNFPRFMTHVREVEDLGAGRSRWTVAGPAGVPIQWEATITEREPNRRIDWKTMPGAAVEHEGHVHFEPIRDGGTQVSVIMSYNPPAGTVGHGVASLLGADPKRQLDDDLLRMKTLIETGRPPHDAARPEARTFVH